MIKFFRKIRKNLLTQNKVSKYLLYAIGEIVLVVIGILIALSINNWNESRKLREMEIRYLDNLIVDLSSDTAFFADKITLFENALKELNTYLSKSYEEQRTIDDVMQLFSYLNLATEHLVIQNPTYLDILSSGNLSIFSNDELKKSIMTYYKFYEEQAVKIKEYNLVSTQYMIEADQVAPSASKFYDPQFLSSEMYIDGEWDYINKPLSKEFLALQLLVTIYMDRNQKHLGYLESLKSNATTLIGKIQEELSDRSN